MRLTDVPQSAYNSSVQMAVVRSVAARLGVGSQLVDVTSARAHPSGGTLLGLRVLAAGAARARALAACMGVGVPDESALADLLASRAPCT